MAPWTVWACAIVHLAPYAYILVLRLGAIWLDAVIAAILVMLLVWLIRGSRVAWWLLLVWDVGGLLEVLFGRSPNIHDLIIGLAIAAGVALLLARPTREHLRRLRSLSGVA
jgi:hypothetical protein